MDQKFNHLKGIPALGELILPKIEAQDILATFLGALDATKERVKKEVMTDVFDALDKLRGKDGCVAVDVVKKHLSGYFEI